VVGGLTGGGGERRRGCRAAAKVLLGRLAQTASREVVGNGGAPPCPGSTGVELLGHREGEGRSEDVWEVEGGGVNLFG
jgi:hypothetical protein